MIQSEQLSVERGVSVRLWILGLRRACERVVIMLAVGSVRVLHPYSTAWLARERRRHSAGGGISCNQRYLGLNLQDSVIPGLGAPKHHNALQNQFVVERNCTTQTPKQSVATGDGGNLDQI